MIHHTPKLGMTFRRTKIETALYLVRLGLPVHFRGLSSDTQFSMVIIIIVRNLNRSMNPRMRLALSRRVTPLGLNEKHFGRGSIIRHY